MPWNMKILSEFRTNLCKIVIYEIRYYSFWNLCFCFQNCDQLLNCMSLDLFGCPEIRLSITRQKAMDQFYMIQVGPWNFAASFYRFFYYIHFFFYQPCREIQKICISLQDWPEKNVSFYRTGRKTSTFSVSLPTRLVESIGDLIQWWWKSRLDFLEDEVVW